MQEKAWNLIKRVRSSTVKSWKSVEVLFNWMKTHVSLLCDQQLQKQTNEKILRKTSLDFMHGKFLFVLHFTN